MIRKCEKFENIIFSTSKTNIGFESLSFIEPFRFGSKQQVRKLGSISVVIILTWIITKLRNSAFENAPKKLHENNIKLSDEQ